MPAPRPENPSIRNRFILLSGLGVFGAISFLPSITASATPGPSPSQLVLFVVVVSSLSVGSAWFGLRSADVTHLPMPYLRRLDRCAEATQRGGLLPALVFAGLFAAGAVYVLHAFHQPNLAGSLWSRAASVFFAAGSLELFVHLLLMSVAVRLSRGRVWAGILVAALVFVAFHVAGLSGQSSSLVAASVLLNGIFGVALGVFYARYGFEYVLLSHAVAHVLAVTFA